MAEIAGEFALELTNDCFLLISLLLLLSEVIQSLEGFTFEVSELHSSINQAISKGYVR